MNDITFSIKHPDTESLFFISFVRRKGKVQVQGRCFAKGNVVLLSAVREARKVADDHLF